MKQENYDYIANQLKYLGFGDNLQEQLSKHMEKGSDNFTLSTTLHYASFEKKEAQYELNFRKGNEDMYFLNSYQASVDSNAAKFYINNGEKNITSKEAFNLMEGRAVYRELTNKEGEKYNAWQKIDTENSNGENIRFKSFTDNYGYDLEAAMKTVKPQQLYFGLDHEKAVHALQKGNLVEVKNMDKSQKYFIAADPQFKTMLIFDEQGNKMKPEALAKSASQENEKQSAGMKV